MRHILSKLLGLFGLLGLLGFSPLKASAYAPITLRHDHHLFSLDPDLFPQWREPEEIWTFNGSEIIPPSTFRIDGDAIPALSPGFAKSTQTGWRLDAIQRTVEERISAKFNRPAGAVTISKSSSGSVAFDGVGLTGRAIDAGVAAQLILAAIKENITDIELPVRETPAQVTVTDPRLQQLGIREVVTIGESNFAGSPVNRRHNIGVGLSKFNGHIIPQNTIFSFNQILGRVDGSTGYRKELVIKGDRTEPDYGGGLCQVSTTAYRGAWEHGFPIEQRKNHSYAVGYYGPQGTDATVYPPNPDMKFHNDGPSALLMQTHQENDNAYFIYYGTRDSRTADVWGPVVLGTSAVPPDREVFTTELPPGERRKVGDRHPGITVLWFRTRTPDPAIAAALSENGATDSATTPTAHAAAPAPTASKPITERVLSIYEARPLFYEVGVISLPDAGSGLTLPITVDEI